MKCSKKSQVLSVVLSLCLVASFLPGCSKSDNSGASEVSATPVEYNAQGKFSTTLTVPGAKFSKDVNASDVAVECDDTQANIEEMQKLQEAGASTDGFEAKTVSATIETVTRKSNDTLEVTFADSKVKDNAPVCYGITVAEGKTGNNKEASANIDVEYPQDLLQPNVDYVLSTDKEIRLTLELKEGTYSEGVTTESVTLGGSFENLKIDSISSAGKNLTMQLTGDIAKHESSGAYLDGIVTVSKNAIADAAVDAKVSIPVQTEQACFVSEDLTADGSKVTVPLSLVGVADTSSLTKDNIKFEKDANVTDVKKDSDTQVTLTLDVTGATDANSAADVLDGQTVTIADAYTFTSSFTTANFYPVFDYVEKQGNDLKFTLELYANSGTFADGFNKSQVTLGEEFAEGKVVSLDKKSESVAELVISVPAGDNDADNFEVGGEVTLAAGAMTNTWGDATSADSSYYRNYTKEEMGRDFSAADIDTMKEIVGGFGNTTFGTVSSVVSGAATAYSAVKTILEMAGVIKSEHQVVMEKLESISNQISEVQNTLNQHTLMLNDVQSFQYMESMRDFNTKLHELETYCNRVGEYYKNAASDDFQNTLSIKEKDVEKAIDDADYAAWLEEEYQKQVAERQKQEEGSEGSGDETYEHDPRNEVGDPTAEMFQAELEQEAAISDRNGRLYYEYSRGLIKAMEEADANGDGRFKGFKYNLQQLDEKYVEVASYLKNTQNNPIDIFDKSCTYIYNFDTSAYGIRDAFRMNLENTLSAAVSYITLYYSPVNPTSTEAMNLYVNSHNQLENRPLTKRTDGKAFLYVKGVNVYVAANPEITDYFKAAYKKTYFKDISEISKASDFSKSSIAMIIGCKFYMVGEKVYTYDTNQTTTLGAMLKVSSLGLSNEDYRKCNINFSSNEITMFCDRMKKRNVTLKQEFESAGINVPNNTEGMAVEVWLKERIKGKYIKWDANKVESEVLNLGLVWHKVSDKSVKILPIE